MEGLLERDAELALLEGVVRARPSAAA